MSDAWSDEAQFESVYRSTYRDVAAYCRRRLAHDEWEDAVADVYRVAWEKRSDLLGADKRVAWLLGVSFNIVSTRYRKRSRIKDLKERLRHNPPRPEVEPDQAVMSTEAAEALRKAVARLKPIDQELIRLVAFEELTYDEIALVTGLSEASVRTRIHRARQRLKRATDAYRAGDR